MSGPFIRTTRLPHVLADLSRHFETHAVEGSTVSFSPNPEAQGLKPKVTYTFFGTFRSEDAPDRQFYYHVRYTYAPHPRRPTLEASLSVGREDSGDRRPLLSWSHDRSLLDSTPTFLESQYEYVPRNFLMRLLTRVPHRQKVTTIVVPHQFNARLYSLLRTATAAELLFDNAEYVAAGLHENPVAAEEARNRILQWLRSHD